jgi:hypothetical protein
MFLMPVAGASHQALTGSTGPPCHEAQEGGLLGLVKIPPNFSFAGSLRDGRITQGDGALASSCVAKKRSIGWGGA